jgi:DNA polymerase
VATVKYWPALEDAASRAAQTDAIIAAGPTGRQVKFRRSGSFLWCQLPSGRVLCYPYPQIRQIETPWGEMKDALTYMTVPQPDDKRKGKIIDDPSNRNDWARISTYGGKLAENCTQAVARDLLAEAMLRLEGAGASPVLHVHDEILIETAQTAPAEALPAFERIVNTVPAWATGLPIAADGWRAHRYGKHD